VGFGGWGSEGAAGIFYRMLGADGGMLATWKLIGAGIWVDAIIYSATTFSRWASSPKTKGYVEKLNTRKMYAF
jgi:hypothetical protein